MRGGPSAPLGGRSETVSIARRPATPVVVRRVDGRRDLRAFIRLPWQIYADDPMWVPPLLHDVHTLLDRRKHPFHQHADVEYFLAWRGSQVVGRIAAIVNRQHVDFHGENAGFFGLFEAEPDGAIARALLAAAETFVAHRGMSTLRGPVNLSTNDELYSPGVLIDGFDSPPCILMAHTPRYYRSLLENAGYQKAKDLLAFWLRGPEPPERLVRAMDRIVQRSGATLRPLNLGRFDEEVAIIQDIYNDAWERNWGFVPMTEAEIVFLAKSLRPVVNADMCAIAEVGGEPIGFGLTLPDFNQVLRHLDGRLLPFGFLKLLWYKRKIDQARVLTLGLKAGYRNSGLDAALILRMYRENVRAGYPKGECSWILEDNWEMRRGMERIGGEVYKTYRVFEKPVAL
ncbi:MAG: N-acetyltransferase [Longimicrobiales bacterium]